MAIECAEMSPPYAEIKELFRVILAVATGPPPKLRNEAAASRNFRDFLSAALMKNPTFRSTAAQLEEMPFVATAPARALDSLAAEQAEAIAAQPEEWKFETTWDTLGT